MVHPSTAEGRSGRRIVQFDPRYPAGQLRQGKPQVDLVLQAGVKQIVGLDSEVSAAIERLAHQLVRYCKKTAVSVAKTGSPSTREKR